VNDTVMFDIESGKIKDFVKFDVGNLAMVTGGHNNGRVGTIVHKEKHKVGRCGATHAAWQSMQLGWLCGWLRAQ
jgi:ribosomal protein S4E